MVPTQACALSKSGCSLNVSCTEAHASLPTSIDAHFEASVMHVMPQQRHCSGHGFQAEEDLCVLGWPAWWLAAIAAGSCFNLCGKAAGRLQEAVKGVQTSRGDSKTCASWGQAELSHLQLSAWPKRGCCSQEEVQAPQLVTRACHPSGFRCARAPCRCHRPTASELMECQGSTCTQPATTEMPGPDLPLPPQHEHGLHVCSTVTGPIRKGRWSPGWRNR
jgi:hypothetical protein